MQIVNVNLGHALETATADKDLFEFGTLAEIEELGGLVARKGGNVEDCFVGI